MARTPLSTYRLQITAEADLFAAADRLGYLHELGVDWVYLSPILEAEAGSDHGYDVLRHDRVDPVRGGPEGLAALSAQARRLGLGVLVDIVPNHVGVAAPQPGTWWWDLLQHGQDSPFATYFDVDWAAGGSGGGRVLLPVLGDDADLTSDLQVVDGELHYFDHAFPLAPGSDEGSPTPAQVHDRQHYELVSWRRADSDLNYRRFFAVNTLAAIRVEDREVFDASHVEIKRWFDEGLVDGLRVDHPDGLREPGRYLDDLAELTGGAYVLVEKILEPGERLLGSWATAGTTGYDALGLVDRVLTDVDGQAALTGLETRLRGAEVADDTYWTELIHGTKRDVADGILGSETRRIVRESALLMSSNDDSALNDVSPTLNDMSADAESALLMSSNDDSASMERLVDAVAELLACFPVYRSYLPDGLVHLKAAFASARHHRPDLTDTLDLLWPVLSDAEHPGAKRFQQTSGMVMAKGVEDCAFYRYSRLTSLNEVGGDPSEFAEPVAAFHEAMTDRQRDWPQAMTCGTTHDTKRGEDVRARIAVLAEVPDAWAGALEELLALAPLPDPGFGSLLWQAILGAWGSSPDDELRARLHGYAEKAMREAGDRTQWTAPDEAYETAVQAAVDAAFDHPEVRRVLESLLDAVEAPGWSNALAAKLIALTMPGVPDVYQGSELWEQSLVDPDNRRPVDFALRAAVLGGADHPAAGKLRLVRDALTLRRDRPELFTGYTPVEADGPAAAHVLAFDRGGAVTVATRLPVGLQRLGGWAETTVTLSDGVHRVADLLAGEPAALYLTEDA